LFDTISFKRKIPQSGLLFLPVWGFFDTLKKSACGRSFFAVIRTKSAGKPADFAFREKRRGKMKKMNRNLVTIGYRKDVNKKSV
jgi:hypothetical protein